MSDVKAIEVRAEIRQIKTMADHTVNVILNLPEDCIPQAQKLMEWLGLEVGCVIVNADDEPQLREKTGDDRPRSKQRKVRSGQ